MLEYSKSLVNYYYFLFKSHNSIILIKDIVLYILCLEELRKE